jgi:hypothetical protein
MSCFTTPGMRELIRLESCATVSESTFAGGARIGGLSSGAYWCPIDGSLIIAECFYFPIVAANVSMNFG